MAGMTHTIRVVYTAYAATLILAGGASLVLAAISSSPAAFGDFLAGGWIFAGVAWVLAAFLASPNVSTYLGPGGYPVRGGAPPIVVPAVAVPARNPQVLADLGKKLSRGTDLAALLAILGVLLLVAGAVASVGLWLGVAAGAALLLLVAFLARAATDRPPAPRPT